MEQLVHGASKQAANPAAGSPSTTPALNEARPVQGNEGASNAEAMNQMSTAPPGTGPPPTLNEAPENTNASEPSQTNGKLSVFHQVFFNIILFIIFQIARNMKPRCTKPRLNAKIWVWFQTLTK